MRDLIQDYYSDCFKADMPAAFRTIKNAGRLRDKKAEALRRKVLARFIERTETERIRCDDNFVRSVIKAYRSYYQQAFLQRDRLPALSKGLSAALKTAARRQGISSLTTASGKKFEENLKKEVKRRGFFSLLGCVAPFRSLLVWRREYPRTFKVKLPETTQNVKVVFLKQIIELGWLHYATFGRYHVGGWAEKTAIFCVKQAYKTGSRNFKVNYLSHEAQHFADYKMFPKLKTIDLEYRAKLVQLAFTDDAKTYLKRLENEAKNDPQSPHSFAAYKILQHFKTQASKDKISARAVQLLCKHTAALRQAGAKKVKSILVGKVALPAKEAMGNQ